MITKYHQFNKVSILEKENEKVDKKNISYEKSDTGKTSAYSYKIFLQEIFTSLDAMTAFISPANQNVLSKTADTKASIGSSLKNSVDSHRSLLDELVSLSSTISKEMPVNSSTEKIGQAYVEQKTALEKDLKDGKITQEELDKKLEELKAAADKDVEKAKDVYYQKAPSILEYYKEAIKAFATGAKKDLDIIQKEEASGDIGGGDNITDWLSDITDYAEGVLFGSKKAK